MFHIFQLLFLIFATLLKDNLVLFFKLDLFSIYFFSLQNKAIYINTIRRRMNKMLIIIQLLT